MEGEINNVLDEFFTRLKLNGMQAIAYCDSEKGRVTMLELMEYAVAQEIVIKRIVQEISGTTIITNEAGIDEKTLGNLPEGARVIETTEDDESK